LCSPLGGTHTIVFPPKWERRRTARTLTGYAGRRQRWRTGGRLARPLSGRSRPNVAGDRQTDAATHGHAANGCAHGAQNRRTWSNAGDGRTLTGGNAGAQADGLRPSIDLADGANGRTLTGYAGRFKTAPQSAPTVADGRGHGRTGGRLARPLSGRSRPNVAGDRPTDAATHGHTANGCAHGAQNRRAWSNAGDGRTLTGYADRFKTGGRLAPFHQSGRQRERSNAGDGRTLTGYAGRRQRWRTYGRLAPRARPRWRTGADMGARTDGLQGRFRGVPVQMWRATGRRTRQRMDTRPTVAPTARRIGAHGRTLTGYASRFKTADGLPPSIDLADGANGRTLTGYAGRFKTAPQSAPTVADGRGHGRTGGRLARPLSGRSRPNVAGDRPTDAATHGHAANGCAHGAQNRRTWSNAGDGRTLTGYAGRRQRWRTYGRLALPSIWPT